ncbi:hypothetical protein Pla144_47330 [Bythopirellula polymerisocia]|uniref:Uncharacterized protein n=1 Tax=Bythopirellula polymerisocia TaxID=2528003 RepID=A0A5C6C9D3_9BACT|nr:hypothetical protein Pla144_47330 [Bythopirellula polymerisocia]
MGHAQVPRYGAIARDDEGDQRSGLVGRARPQLLRCYAATELGADLPAGLTPKTNVRILTDTTLVFP